MVEKPIQKNMVRNFTTSRKKSLTKKKNIEKKILSHLE